MPQVTDWTKYPNFTEAEFTCHCGCGATRMDPDFMDRLQALRTALGVPFKITSGYRCPTHEQAIGGGGNHTHGKAADIALSGAAAFGALGLIAKLGFTGIGLRQKGSGRFIHLDTMPPGLGKPRPWVWTY